MKQMELRSYQVAELDIPAMEVYRGGDLMTLAAGGLVGGAIIALAGPMMALVGVVGIWEDMGTLFHKLFKDVA